MRSQTWCTDEQSPGHRFAYWRDEICHQFSIDLNCRPRQRKSQEPFFGQLKTHELGPLLFTNTIVNACEISRPAHAIAVASKKHYQLTLIRSGQVQASQGKLEWDLATDDLILLDYDVPYNFSLSAQAQLFSVLIPGEYLERRTGRLRELFIRPAAQKLSAVSLAAEFLKILPPQLDQANPHVENRIAEHVTDIVATTLLSSAELSQNQTSPALANVLKRAYRVIDAELGNNMLSPAAIASALGISARYLNLAFSAGGQTVMRYIRDKRLDHCRYLLSDPLHTHRRISDIAYTTGFSDLSIFNRSFRERFGMSPRQARQR